ncbi:MAG: FtsX-like permease family protein [Geminicoccaceae bacterium]|nr:MAG: FtsX-like permease family protein [Geminicoccaceae bacterium]
MSWSLALRLVWRDLRGSPHLLWIVVALAFGVATLAAVGTARQAVLDALERDAAILLGGDVALATSSTPLTDDERARAVPSGARTSDVVTTTTLLGRVDGEAEVSVALKGVDAAYPLYGTVRMAPQLPIQDALRGQGIVVGQGLLDRLGVAVGDEVRIGEAVFTVRAELIAEPDRAAGGPFQIGPRVLVDDTGLVAAGILREGSVARFSTRIALPPGLDAERAVAEIQAANPEARFRVESAATSQPELTNLIGRLATFLTLAALAALATGGLGIALATRSHLAGKLATIGTLRALGGRPGWVGGLYGVQLAVLGAFGIALGLAIGAALPFLLVLLPADVLPVEVTPTPIPSALLLAAAIGALVLALFAWLPLSAARRTSPASLFRGAADIDAGATTRGDYVVVASLALALIGLVFWTADAPNIAATVVGGVLGAAAVLLALVVLLQRAAGSLARIAPPRLRLPLREIARPGGETTPTVLALALGLGLLTVVGQTGRTLDAEISTQLPARMASTVFIDIQPAQRDPFVAAVEEHPSAELMELFPYLRARLVRIAGETASAENVDPGIAWSLRGDRGLTWLAEPPADEGPPVEGAWWPADYRGPLQVAIPLDFARGYRVGVGDTLGFNVLGRILEAEIAAIRPNIEWGAGGFGFVFVFSPGVLEAAPHGFIAAVDVPPAERAALLTTMRDVGSNITPVLVDEAIAAFAGVLERVRAAVAFIAGLTLASGLVVLAAGLNAVRARQRYASAILKALGARRGDLVRTFLVEHAALGAVAGIAGIALGLAGAFMVAQFALALPFAASAGQAALILALALALTTATGLLGLNAVVRQSAQRLLRAG